MTTKLMSRHQIVGMVFNATRSEKSREHFSKLLCDLPCYEFENQHLYDAKNAIAHIGAFMMGDEK